MDSRHAKAAIDVIDGCLSELPKLDWNRAQVEVENLLLDVRNLLSELELLDQIERELQALKRRRFLL